MNTFSKKYFNKDTNQWEPLYATEGRSAYETAKLNGFTGTEEEFNKVLSEIPGIIDSIENQPTEGSKNLITSGGVWAAIDELDKSVGSDITKLEEKVNTNTSNIATIETDITNIKSDISDLETKVDTNTSDIANNKSTIDSNTTNINSNRDSITALNGTVTNISTEVTRIVNTEIPDQIKASIIDSLESTDPNKALSANQGNVLKTMIGNLANLQIKVVDTLPSTGETNIIYLVKKEGTTPDVHDEYVYVEGA